MPLDIVWLITAVIAFTIVYCEIWVLYSTMSAVRKRSSDGPFKFELHEPKMGILLPCVNEEAVIGSAIEECLSQTFENKETVGTAHNCTDSLVYSVDDDVLKEKTIGHKLNYTFLCFLEQMKNMVFLSMLWSRRQKLDLMKACEKGWAESKSHALFHFSYRVHLGHR